ncbi:MAG: ribokinase [Spirochaetaceae bacterium]|nr:MAG: ribokinase [Spirochaetaceae bacterium]
MSEPTPRTAITVLGSLNFDVLFSVDALPEQGETRAARSFSFECGGKGANQAAQAALLGASVHMVGAVGDDPVGHHLVNRLQSSGVDVQRIRVVSAPTGVGVVTYLDSGSVAALIGPGANAELSNEDLSTAEWCFDRSSVALFQLESPVDLVAAGIRVAAERGCRTVLNGAPAAPLPPDVFGAIDTFIVNEVEAAYYSQPPDASRSTPQEFNVLECGSSLRDRFQTNVVVTVGKEGCWGFEVSGSNWHVPAVTVRAVETTGAGDSFIGAFAVGLTRGMSYQDCAQLGAVAASITVTKVGAQSAMPTRGMLRDKGFAL